MTFYFTAGTTWILLPGQLVKDAKEYSWLVFIWALVYGLALALLWLYLSSLYPGKSLVEIAKQVLGKWAGGVVSLCYIVFFIQIASWVTRNLADFMQINMMPKTPVAIFNLLLLTSCCYAVVKGISSIAMVTELLMPYIQIVYWIPVVSGLATGWDWHNFRSPDELHMWRTLVETRYVLGFPFMETVSFMMLFPFVKSRLKTAYLLGILAPGLVLIGTMLIIIGVLGVNRSSHLIYPVFIMFRELQFTGFLEHLESILAVNILLIVCLKLSIVFYCAVLAICQLFQIKKRTTVAIPLVWVIVAYSLSFQNIVQNIEWVKSYLLAYYCLFGIVFPLLLIVCAWIQKKNTVQPHTSLKIGEGQ
ncbi:endospore germination permease [Paenibacillus sp. R14(2021)]|uniref:GerAB/ArcD/ProY family transporter n=1 Tax=Paenibacillus sp. R14(2021) TaxID=2859228 RepID=UPI001C612921|nr:endospore germination permease [Paenibacillus sp. R14(2021)]